MEPIPINGAMDRLGCPVAVELDGRLLRIRQREDLMLRQIEAWHEGHPRTYWKVELEDRRTAVIYRDLLHTDWWLEPASCQA